MAESKNKDKQATEPQDDVANEDVPSSLSLSKTPFYSAVHAARYQRQQAIRDIESVTKRHLICYLGGANTTIDRDDVVGFVDMLHNCPVDGNLDLLLHPSGGDMDAAEKLITIVRKKVGNGRLRVVVPDYAKSAGTLMALGADSIVMSDTSELGPIDPQIVLADGNGNRIRHSAQSYIDAYEFHRDALKEDPQNVTAQLMLSKLDPATVKLFEKVMDRSRQFAEKLLKTGMLKNGNWSLAASNLIDTKEWQSHAQMISWEDASDPKIGLVVEYLPPEDYQWELFWRLYCLQRLAIKDDQKLFESNYASLIMDATT